MALSFASPEYASGEGVDGGAYHRIKMGDVTVYQDGLFFSV